MSADIRPLTDDDLYPEVGDTRPLTKAQARRVTEAIKLDLIGLWTVVKMAYVGRAWEPLGYPSWDEYCRSEFPTSRFRLPREERTEVVSSLRESGLSIRAIASATGLGKGTVERELPAVPNGTPEPKPIAAVPPGGLTEDTPGQTERVAEELERVRQLGPAPVLGMDKKNHPPSKPSRPQETSKPRRGPLADDAARLTRDLGRITKRLEKLLDDDRFGRNKDVIGNRMRPDVKFALEALGRLDREINGGGADA
jgi:hypothetical protein